MDKHTARVRVAEQLSRISASDHRACEQRVYANVVELLRAYDRAKDARRILLYSPIAKWRELGIERIIQEFPDKEFLAVCPHKQASSPLEDFDIIFVPLYGFSPDGYRLGHGGGWYDRLLAQQPKALRVGIGMAATAIDFQRESHDQAMDVIITEQKVWYTRRNT